MLTILDAIRDPQLSAPWFRDARTWRAWLAFLAALFALPMDAEGLALYQRYTGRETVLTDPASEAWVIVGRRRWQVSHRGAGGRRPGVLQGLLRGAGPGRALGSAAVASERIPAFRSRACPGMEIHSAVPSVVTTPHRVVISA
jgi:hypothetical protein